ncbi:MAG: HD domain-containing protein [Defluviitaleaceae bacterium]|nr:HD domain-containing protein [Defluviitaleaceae bacterium]
MRYIEDFRDDERIIDHYLCKQKNSLKTNAGKTYLSLKLQDKTGIIDAKVWEMNNDIQAFEVNDYVKIDAVVTTYRNELQLKVAKIRKSLEGEFDPADYIKTSEKDMESIHTKLIDYIKSIRNPHVKSLLEKIFVEDEYISVNIKTHSAGKSMHHSFMGGWLEHTVSVVEICDFMSGRYKHVNRDILIAGAMLHDVGKLYELSALPENEYTDDGQLLGHIIIGIEIIEKYANEVENFPRELKSLIKHCVISHHGKFEFGSPKLPQIIEAFIISFADDIDSKVQRFEEIISKDNTSAKWLGKHWGFGDEKNRELRKSNFEV